MSVYPATGFEDGLQYTYTIGSGIASVTSYNDIVTNVTILADFEVDGNTYIVTSIGNQVFFSKNNLLRVAIPASVTSIGSQAFNNCTSLAEVTFAGTSQLETISDSAFAGTGLTTISIPASVITIGIYAFYGCTSLTTVTFSGTSQLETINEGVFTSTGLTTIIIPASVITIESSAFYDCTSLTTVTFAGTSQLETIGTSAFRESGLSTISIPASVITIGLRAFGYCGALTSIVVDILNANYSSEAGVLFDRQINTTLIQFPSGKLGPYTIPATVTIIGNYAFAESTLSSIDIPNSVTSIGLLAFDTCTSLTTVTFAGTSQLQTIGTSAFQESGLTTISIPASVTSIGSQAFSDCTSLTTVTFAGTSQLETISDSAFAGTGLTTISIPESVTTIGIYAFYSCTSLTTVTFSGTSQLETISEGVFTSTGLTTISIPESVTSIEEDAFYGCTSLTTIVWVDPRLFQTLGDDAFDTEIPSSPLGSVTYYQTYYNSSTDTDLPAVLNPPAGPGSIYLGKYAITYINESGTPTAPTSVQAITTGSTTADVSFDRPTTPAGSTIISYTVTSIPAGVSQTFTPQSNNPIIVPVSGLAGGTQYTFTVVANNQVGPSPSSAPSNSITTARAGGITSGPAAAGQTTIPIDNAQAQGFRVGNNIRIKNGPTEEIRVIGGFDSIITTVNLTNTYPTGSTLTQITAPGAPTNLVATAGNAEVSVSFTVDDGGSPITNILYSTDGVNFTDSDSVHTASSIIISGLNNDQTYSFRLKATNAFGTGPASDPVSATPVLCFNKGTEILCLNKETAEEEYVLIENLKKGDLVKSFNHGYRKIDIILHKNMVNTPSKWHACMFKMKKTESNGLTKDLIVTGGHSILVDDLGELKEINDQMFGGNTPKIDDKYLLLSSVSPDFLQLENHYIYTWYHFTLENDGDDDRRFGVWANGILTETPSKNFFMQMV